MSDLLKVRVGGSDYLCKWTPSYKIIGERKYNTAVIGNQEWLAENLDYKFEYNDSILPIGGSGSPTTAHAWYYNNDEAAYGVNGNKYGLLYNWLAVKYLSDNKESLLPDGWKIPSTTDYDTLASYTGGNNCGAKLKSTTGWSMGAGDDSYGFCAYPAGRYSNGFYELSDFAYFWTLSEYSSGSAYTRYFTWNGNRLDTSDKGKANGYSLRLVRSIA